MISGRFTDRFPATDPYRGQYTAYFFP